MKLHFSSQTFDIAESNGSLFSVIGSLSGVQVHSPCGGRGTCKKCLVALSGDTSAVPSKARAALSDADAADFLAKCRVPDACKDSVTIVYACLVPSTDGIEDVFLPDYEQLTGAGVAASKDSITSKEDFVPVVRVKKISLTKPTIEAPLDTYANLVSAVRTAFADETLASSAASVTIPDDVLAETSALIRKEQLELYAAVTVTFAPDQSTALSVARVEKNAFTPLALACDIGTTTVAVSLWNAENGTILAEKVTENPQRRHGSDVISRMSYVTENGTDTLFCEVLGAVRSSADLLLAQSGAGTTDDIVYVTVAGNSTMEHLFASIPTDSFSTVPFFLSTQFGYSVRAGELFAKSPNSGKLFCHANAPVYLAPLSASYVGGDITFGLAYLLTTKPELASAASIFLDLGTNGELCCINTKNPDAEKKYLFAATAAGPALEGAHIQMGMSATEGAIYHVDADTENGGFALKTVQNAQAVGICGSGVIAAISAFLKTGLVTAFGRICDDGEPEDEAYEDIYPLFESALGEDDEGRATIALTEDVFITDGDIRQVQTAKAAISAGTSVLLSKAGVEQCDVDDLYIAGSFGGGIDVTAAAHIGLLPADAVKGDNIHAVGNTSAKGASMFLFSKKFRENLDDVMANSAYVELSSDPSFTEEYVNGMLFGDIE
ncbi:MAG: DUF4445 domain-containing protein [Clostridia bacterium]|nr:DUF4445 domain-containing protein [Clostridia bacterium]